MDNFTFLNIRQGNGCLVSLIFSRNSQFHKTTAVVIIQYPGVFRYVVHILVFSYYLAVLTYRLLSCNSLIILIFLICNSVKFHMAN